jgi:two-component system alkaline phosphatase synthesis response regulator PhoP
MSSQHILLVEDDESLGATLAENLLLEGFTVDWVRDGQQGLQSAQRNIHHLIVLDLMLPGMTGLNILKELRVTSRVPVLMISAKGSAMDRIVGLEHAADDYLPKPFHLREFLLRIQNLLRREQNFSTQTLPHEAVIGEAVFNLASRTVQSRGEKVEQLSDKEIKLLQLLLSRTDSVVNRKEILDLVWGFNQFPTTRTVDNLIVQLRKWIEPDPGNPVWIISHRGVGYSLNSKQEKK